MSITTKNIQEGMFVTLDGKKFLVCKVNKNFFYAKELEKSMNPKDFLNKFKEKPKSQKIEDFCKITGTFKASYNDNYELSQDTPVISDKEIKKKKVGISPCCASHAAVVYRKHKNSGRSSCKKCGKIFNIVKLESNDWLSISQDYNFYQVNLITGDVRFLKEMALFRVNKHIERITKKDFTENENDLTKTTQSPII